MSLAWICFEIFLNGYDAAYLMSIVTVKTWLKSWVSKTHLVFFWCALVCIYCYINFSTNFTLISMYLFPVLTFIFIFAFTKGPILHRFFWFIFAFTLLACIELFTLSCFMFLHASPLEAFTNQTPFRLQWILIAKSIDTAVWYYLLKHREITFQHCLPSLKLLTWIVLGLFLSISSIFSSNLITSLYIKSLLSFTPLLILGLGFCFSVLFVSVFIEKKNLALQGELAQQKSSLHQEMQDFEQQGKPDYHAEISHSYHQSRQFRNHILQHLQTLRPLSSQSELPFQKFMEGFEQINQPIQLDYQTGNSLMDVVLAIKEAEAFSHGIALHVQGKVPTASSFPAEDLSLLMDYFVTEALDEVAEITDVEAIAIHFQNTNKGFVVTIENPTQSEKNVKKEKPQFMLQGCRSEEGSQENLQIQIIQEILQKYRGGLSILFEYADYYRTTYIQFPSEFPSELSELEV